jgi:hypothetical protein
MILTNGPPRHTVAQSDESGQSNAERDDQQHGTVMKIDELNGVMSYITVNEPIPFLRRLFWPTLVKRPSYSCIGASSRPCSQKRPGVFHLATCPLTEILLAAS